MDDRSAHEAFLDLIEYDRSQKLGSGTACISAYLEPGYRRIGRHFGPGAKLDKVKPSVLHIANSIIALPAVDIWEASECYKVWSKIVPVIALGELSCVRRKKEVYVIAYVYEPFHKASTDLWRKLVEMYRANR